MVIDNDAPLHDISIFIRSVENVFRKLIRLLIGRMSLGKIQELIQIIFVEEAEAILQKESPGIKVALGDLVMLCGVDSETIKKTRTYIELSKPVHEDESFLCEIVPESCILDIWESSSKFTDENSGEPKVLSISGPGDTFESLIGETFSAGDVSVERLLERLVASKSVRVLEDSNEVQLIDKHYTTFELQDETENLKFGFAVVGNLLDTVAHNLNAPSQDRVPFYQQGCWTRRLDEKDGDEFRTVFRQFLSKKDEEARDIIKRFEQESASDGQMTAGVSMFYFEEKIDSHEVPKTDPLVLRTGEHARMTP